MIVQLTTVGQITQFRHEPSQLPTEEAWYKSSRKTFLSLSCIIVLVVVIYLVSTRENNRQNDHRISYDNDDDIKNDLIFRLSPEKQDLVMEVPKNETHDYFYLGDDFDEVVNSDNIRDPADRFIVDESELDRYFYDKLLRYMGSEEMYRS